MRKIRKTIFLIAVLVVLLGVPAIIKAEAPGGLDRAPFVLKGPDFVIPGDGEWSGKYYEYGEDKFLEMNSSNSPSYPSCYWPNSSGANITAAVETRAKATINGSPVYARGDCYSISIGGIKPDSKQLEVEIWYWWMGTEKSKTYTVEVSGL